MPNQCQKFQSQRLLLVNAKCSDLCQCIYQGKDADRETDGYVPYNLNVGGGDYVEFTVCLDCGQVQGTFPVPEEATAEAFPNESAFPV